MQPELAGIRLTSKDCIDALRQHYRYGQGQYEWVFVDEVALRTGGGQRMDAFALNCWPSESYISIAFEVKVSRTDYLREVRRPDKRKAAMLLSNYFMFVCPEGLLRPDEMPVDCGLMHVKSGGVVRVVKQAPHRDRLPASWALLAVLLRTMQNRAEWRGNVNG